MSCEKDAQKSTALEPLFHKKRLQHWCFPVNIAKVLRTPNFKNICERLLLILSEKREYGNGIFGLKWDKTIFNGRKEFNIDAFWLKKYRVFLGDITGSKNLIIISQVRS